VVIGRSAGPPPISWEACRSHHLSVHRRSSGGGVVLWDFELVAVDVVLPVDHPLLTRDVVEAYRWVGEAVAEALQVLGLQVRLIDVDLARAIPTDPLTNTACFGSLSPWEVTVDGRKVVGLSQVRRREGAVIQVGIPLGVDVPLLASVIGGRNDGLAEALGHRMAGVRDVVPSISRNDLVSTTTAALEERLGSRSAVSELRSSEQAVEADLAATQHAPLSQSD